MSRSGKYVSGSASCSGTRDFHQIYCMEARALPLILGHSLKMIFFNILGSTAIIWDWYSHRGGSSSFIFHCELWEFLNFIPGLSLMLSVMNVWVNLEPSQELHLPICPFNDNLSPSWHLGLWVQSTILLGKTLSFEQNERRQQNERLSCSLL